MVWFLAIGYPECMLDIIQNVNALFPYTQSVVCLQQHSRFSKREKSYLSHLLEEGNDLLGNLLVGGAAQPPPQPRVVPRVDAGPQADRGQASP